MNKWDFNPTRTRARTQSNFDRLEAWTAAGLDMYGNEVKTYEMEQTELLADIVKTTVTDSISQALEVVSETAARTPLLMHEDGLQDAMVDMLREEYITQMTDM